MGGLTRSQGKVAVLALGYNGGIGSLRAMGGQGSDPDLQLLVDQWRRANPAICDLWKQMDGSFRFGGTVGDHVSVEAEGNTRLLRLPSGRAIVYHGCKWGMVDSAWGPRSQASFLDPRSGQRVTTYGGRLTENITQAVARDILAEALVRLHTAGYVAVGHVHDEILVEGTHSIDDVRQIMNELPDWAEDLPIDSAGFTTNRYRKG